MNRKALSEVVRLLGIPAHRIVYAHQIGAVLEPKRVCGRRAYAERDIMRLARHFGIDGNRKDNDVQT